jgi:hypothetical protein
MAQADYQTRTLCSKGVRFDSDDFAISSGVVSLKGTPDYGELNFLDGATAGTIVASKCVVANAASNIGKPKMTGFYLGASGSETEVTATAAELNKLASSGAVVASGTAGTHVADLKADYIATDIDDAGTINGTEVAVVLNLIAGRCNALVARLEAFKINASS